jgi:hypothetical protein
MSEYERYEDRYMQTRMEAPMESAVDFNNLREFEAVSVADFEGECADPFCNLPITPGTDVKHMSGTENFVHAHCPEPPESPPYYLGLSDREAQEM